MLAKKINHLGIAVKNIETASPFYRDVLGMTFEGTEEVAEQKVRVAFFAIGESRIELLEPTSPDSPVAKFIEKNGEGLHHVAFGTSDILAQLGQAAASGCRLLNEKPFEGAGGKLVAFLHPKSTHGVLTEFCSAK